MSKWGAAAACWAFYDDRDDRLTEILRLLPEAFPSSLMWTAPEVASAIALSEYVL